MSKKNSNVPSKSYSFLFSEILQILAYVFHFTTKFLHRSFEFEYSCTSKFDMTLLRVYSFVFMQII